MNKLSGYCEIEMGGNILPFKFGTNCFALFCEKRNIEFHEIAESGAFSGDFIALRDLYYSAYESAVRAKGEKVKYNIEQFGDMIDETSGVVEKLNDTLLTAKVMGFTFEELAKIGEGGVDDPKKK